MVRSYEFIPDVIDVKVLVSSGGFIPVIMVEKWEPDRRPVFAIMYLQYPSNLVVLQDLAFLGVTFE